MGGEHDNNAIITEVRASGNGAGGNSGENTSQRRKCELIILAQGKFGARELNYYSDLDIVFLYEEDGQTAHARRSRRDVTTTNQHFFGELGQRIIKVGSQLGPHGKLFPIDPRLRPTGKSGSLATSKALVVRAECNSDNARSC